MATILNATPKAYSDGTQDLSTKTVTLPGEELPSHLPVVFLYTVKGPDSYQCVSGDTLTDMYGSDSFDPMQKYFNHATALAYLMNSKGNALMVKRVKPTDATTASLRFWLDVLPTNIPQYLRNSDGSFETDSAGNYVSAGTTKPGFIVKWVVSKITSSDDVQDDLLTGQATIKAGTQTDPTTNTQSKMYPIFDFPLSYFGNDGNYNGIRIWAPTTATTEPIDTTLLDDNAVYPLRLSVIYKDPTTGTVSVKSDVDGEQYIDCCLKELTINQTYTTRAYLGDIFLSSYQSIDDSSTGKIFSRFDDVYIYQDNIQTLLAEFYAAEVAVSGTSNSFSDFDGTANEMWRFNFLSGVSSTNLPYYTFQINSTDTDAVLLTDTANIFATGGADGTFSNSAFDNLVIDEMADYAEDTEVTDTALHPESIIYDSGFGLTAKYSLINILDQRKDTMVVLGTHVVGGNALTASEETALAAALRTRIRLHPESSYFGTPAMRGTIVGRSGILLDTVLSYTERLPLTFELAYKAARYMGASDGIWNSTYAFDVNPYNIVELFRPSSINVKFTSSTVRNKDWANGLNYVQAYDMSRLFFPAWKTVYDDDTSVLNSFITVMACIEIQKVADRCWRFYSGEAKYTNAQLVDKVEDFFTEKLKDRFDGRFIIETTCTVTTADTTRGYSWTVYTNIYAPNMKTVQRFYVVAQRIDDYDSTSSS